MKKLPDKDFFRVDEVAEYFDVAPRTVRRWIDDGKLSGTKIVGIIRIPREAIFDLISPINEGMPSAGNGAVLAGNAPGAR